MTSPAQKQPGAGGGSIAIRGFLVQTLVALLDMAQSDPPFIEITLEPSVGDEQFDFIWTDANGAHATQVKTSVNTFEKSVVIGLVKKLEAARSTEDCRLILLGTFSPSLDGINQHGAVRIERKHLNLPDLHEQAAHRLSKFLEAEGLPAGTSADREMVVHALVSKLEHLSTKSESLSREAFIKLLRQWITSVPKAEVKIRIEHIDRHAPAELIGREAELAILSDAWTKAQNDEPQRPRVLTFVALGGEGKTSLVAKWVAGLAHQNWPACEAVFAWSFYSEGTRESASSDLFFKEALTFFGDPELANSAQGAYDKGRTLARIVGQQKALLILDGLEPLQYAPTSPMPGELKDQGLSALLKALAATNQGLCIVTTRYSISDLRSHRQGNGPEIALTRLSTGAGVALIKLLGVRKESGTKEQFECLVEDVKGHALTLNLLGTFLRDGHGGDIRKRDLVKLEEADAENEHGGHAFRVVDAYVKWFESEGDKGYQAISILRLLGLFDRPASADCITALLKPPTIIGITKALTKISETQRNLTIARLENAGLLKSIRDASGTLIAIDSHALLREYFAQKCRLRHPDSYRNAHRRLYEHLCAITPDKPNPTLTDLEPLYKSISHGCNAGLQNDAFEKVYDIRILKKNRHYSWKELGAFGSDLSAITCFFEQPWLLISPSINAVHQGLVMHQAALYLRALGRLNEALGPMASAVEMAVEQKQFDSAARGYSNLSELKLTLGRVTESVEDAELSARYADCVTDTIEPMAFRTSLANSLYQAGDRTEAEAIFCVAEQMQAKRQPAYWLLNSVAGFHYCELLLAEPEIAAWRLTGVDVWHPGDPEIFQRTVEGPNTGATSMNVETERITSELKNSSCMRALCSVSRRATEILQWAKRSEFPFLDIALHQLTLCRAALYMAILFPSTIQTKHSEIDSAVSGLRSAGRSYHLPSGLLTRAWCLVVQGFFTSKHPENKMNDAECAPTKGEAALLGQAIADLNEAWEIAERGPMPLYLADIHLYRARLFFRETNYPWVSPTHDLKEARRLIEKHGYWRRKEELEDAEAAAKTQGWA